MGLPHGSRMPCTQGSCARLARLAATFVSFPTLILHRAEGWSTWLAMQAFAKVQAEDMADAAVEPPANGLSEPKQGSSEAKPTRPQQADSASYEPPSWRGAPEG